MPVQVFAAGSFSDECELARVIEILEKVVAQAALLAPRGLDESFQHFAEKGLLAEPGMKVCNDIDPLAHVPS